MSKIHLLLEVQNNMGVTIKRFDKKIESEYTPSKEMVFTGFDYTLNAKNIYFDVDDGTVSVRFVEALNEHEMNDWDFLTREGWEQL